MLEKLHNEEMDSFFTETCRTMMVIGRGIPAIGLAVTAVPQTWAGAMPPPQPHFVCGQKMTPHEGQRKLRGVAPLHEHTAFEIMEQGVIVSMTCC